MKDVGNFYINYAGMIILSVQNVKCLPLHGIKHHKVTVMSHSNDQAHVSMPGIHRIAALLKRWILGTHQGSFYKNIFNHIWRNLVFDSIEGCLKIEVLFSEDF